MKYSGLVKYVNILRVMEVKFFIVREVINTEKEKILEFKVLLWIYDFLKLYIDRVIYGDVNMCKLMCMCVFISFVYWRDLGIGYCDNNEYV